MKLVYRIIGAVEALQIALTAFAAAPELVLSRDRLSSPGSADDASKVEGRRPIIGPARSVSCVAHRCREKKS